MTKNAPAQLRSLKDIVDEYDKKIAEVSDTIKRLESAVLDVEMQSIIGGTYANNIWGMGGSPSLYARTIERNLLKSAWMHVYKGLNLDQIASASDRKKFEVGMENPPDFTLENISATFGD